MKLMKMTMMKKINNYIIFLIYLLIAHLLFIKVLTLDTFLFGTDTVSNNYIFQYFAWDSILRNHELPLWCPYIFGGTPFISAFAVCPFNISSLFFLIMPFNFAFTYQYLLAVVIAGFSFYLFMRSEGIAAYIAFISGTAFMLCGHFVSLIYAGHLGKFIAISWIPLVFYFLNEGLKNKQIKYFVYAGTALGMQMLASHMQILFYTIVFSSFYFFFKLFVERHKNKFRLIFFFIIFGLFALIISAVQLLPSYETASLSNRGEGLSFEEATHGSFPPEEILEIIFPQFCGDTIRDGKGNYFGRWGERIVSDYVGIVVFILALFGLICSKRKDKYFYILILIISLFLCFGKFNPIYQDIFKYLPGFNKFRSPATIMIFISFPIIILSAFGLEYLFGIKNSEQKKKISIFLLSLGFIAGGMGLFLGNKDFADFILNLFKVQIRIFDEKNAVQKILFDSISRSFLFASAGAAALACVVLIKDHKWIIVKGFVFLIFVLIIFFDLFLHDSQYIQPEPIERYYQYLFEDYRDNFLVQQNHPVRFIEVNNELSNRSIVRGISSIHGYHPVVLRRYMDLIQKTGFYSSAVGKLFYQQFIYDKSKFKDIEKTYKSSTDLPPFVLKRTEELKYIYAPEKIIVIPCGHANNDNIFRKYICYGGNTILNKISKKEFDPYKISYVNKEFENEFNFYNLPCVNEKSEEDKGIPHLGYSERKIDNILNFKYEITDYKNNKMTVVVDMDKEGYLVVSEVNAVGWKAVLDNKEEIPIVNANHLFRMIKMPKGLHNVEFIYSPQSFKIGAILSFLGILVLMMTIVFDIRSRFK